MVLRARGEDVLYDFVRDGYYLYVPRRRALLLSPRIDAEKLMEGLSLARHFQATRMLVREFYAKYEEVMRDVRMMAREMWAELGDGEKWVIQTSLPFMFIRALYDVEEHASPEVVEEWWLLVTDWIRALPDALRGIRERRRERE